jgi:hypothetical protein
MKLSKELTNGFIIFIGIGVYFLTINMLGLSDLFYLRFFNIVFLMFGVNRTMTSNLSEGKKEFLPNILSAFTTAFIGVVLSIVGLIGYSYLHGGDDYVQTLSETFLFGGNPSVLMYSISLLFEGTASAVIVTLVLMFYYNNKYPAD